MEPMSEILPDKLRNLIELVSEGIWTIDAEGRTDFINERGAAMLGYRPEEMIGRPPSDFRVPGLDDDAVIDRIQRNQVRMFEHCMRHRDGSMVWALGSTKPLYDEEGSYQGTVAVLIDVSERKKAMEDLRKSEERLRALVAASSDLMYRVSADWSEVLEIHGGPFPPGTKGETSALIDRFMHPDDRAHALAAIAAAVRDKRTLEMEHRLSDGHGRARWVSTRAVPLIDQDGTIAEWFGMGRDITTRRTAEEGLKRSMERFELLSAANAILLSSRRPEAVIQIIAGKVVEHLGCDLFFNYILDEHEGRLHLNAYYGISRHAAKEVEWLERGAAISGRVALDGYHLVYEDIQHSSDISASLVRALGVQAYACYPIHMGERTIGTLSFGTRDRTTFEEDELSLMRIVAEQVSVSIRRRRAELALRDREERLAQAQRIAHMGSWSWDREEDRLHGSDEAYRIFGLHPGEPQGISYGEYLSLVHPDDRDRVLHQAESLDRQESYEIEYRIVRANGEERQVHSHGVVVRRANGAPGKIVGTIQDFTERRSMEEVVRERGEHLAMAQEIGHMGSWVWDLEKDRFTASDEAFRIFGLRPGEVIVSYSDFLSFIHPDDKQRVVENAQLVYQQDAAEIEYRIIRKDGEERHIHSRGVVSSRKDGVPIRATGVIQDVTGRRRMEEELKESRQRFQALIETNVDFIWETDAQGRYTYCSPQMRTLWGIDPEAMIGRTPFDRMPPGMREEMLGRFIAMASQPQGFRGMESTAVDSHDNIVVVETSGVPFFDAQGKLLGFRGITRDVTERRAGMGDEEGA